jgi:hypothetical protein
VFRYHIRQSAIDWKIYLINAKNMLKKLKPNVGGIWRADELWVKIKGDIKYLFALMEGNDKWLTLIQNSSLNVQAKS